MYTKVKTEAEIASMRVAGKILAQVLQHVKTNAKAGMSTKDLDNLAHKEVKRLGGKPSFLGYEGYPDVLCVSVNDEVVHGLPHRGKILEEGDVVSIDFGVTIDGMITDGAITFVLGEVSNEVKQLVATTEQALLTGIDVLRDGVRVGDVARAIQNVLERKNLGIVRDLVGHGVGHDLHEDPNIPNYGSSGTGPVLKKGMTIAIEPMATLGGHHVVVDPDGWTIRTKDRSLAAHFEHTVLITDKGAEILTLA
jgi:methionyl aminopeptidase